MLLQYLNASWLIFFAAILIFSSSLNILITFPNVLLPLLLLLLLLLFFCFFSDFFLFFFGLAEIRKYGDLSVYRGGGGTPLALSSSTRLSSVKFVKAVKNSAIWGCQIASCHYCGLSQSDGYGVSCLTCTIITHHSFVLGGLFNNNFK